MSAGRRRSEGLHSDASASPQFGGRLGPTHMSASGGGGPPITMPGESLSVFGMGCLKNSIPAIVSDCRSASTNAGAWPVRLIPQKITRENILGCISTSHNFLPAWVFAAVNADSTWLARNRASGSFAGHESITDPPGPFARLSTNRVLVCGGRTHHLAACSTRAACALATAAAFDACPKSRRKYSSFTFPIQTTNTVDTAPITSAPIRKIFDQSYNQDAVSSDGHIRIHFGSLLARFLSCF